MQRRMLIILLIAVVVVVGGYLAYARQGHLEPEADSEEVSEAESLPRVVSASGELVPPQWAVLSFSMGGKLEELAIEVGEEVQAGQVLAHLKADDLEQAVAQAEAALDTAQAILAQAKATPRPQEIKAAEEEVSVALANLAAAQAARDQAAAALEGARAREEAALAELKVAQADLAAANVSVTAAEAELIRLKAGASPQQRAIAKLQIDQARNGLWSAQAQRDSIGGAVDRGEMRQADLDAAEAAVGSAHVAMSIAELTHEEIMAGPRPEEIAPAEIQVEAARVAVTQAEARVEAVKARLDEIREQIASTQAQLAAAEAQVSAAQAQVEQARARLDLLQAGPRAEDVAVAQARVTEAERALEAAQTALDKAQLVAPFAGTVARLEAREWEVILAGQPVLYLGDLSTLQVETTDLNEVDIAQVNVGQKAEITFDALPERVFAGQVESIEPMATPGQGGTNYKVVIRLKELGPELRWGMTAFVDIIVGD